MRTKSLAAFLVVTSVFVFTIGVDAQQVQIQTPFNSVNDSFFERTGVDFGFTIPGSRNFRGGDRARGVFGLTPDGRINPNGIQFTQGSAGLTRPTLGGYDPSGDAHLGFGVRGRNGGGFNLNFFGSKGSSRSLNSTTPSVVVPNGVPGSVFSGSLRPFVTGITPVVGGATISPIDVALQRMSERGETLDSLRMKAVDEQRQAKVAENQKTTERTAPRTVASTASQGALSITEIKRQKAALKAKARAEIDAIVAEVDAAESAGRFGTARTKLNQAIRLASGQHKKELQSRYAGLKNR